MFLTILYVDVGKYWRMTEIQDDKLPLSKNTTVDERERVKRMNKQSQITLTAAYCKRYARYEVRGRGTIAEGRLETKKRRGFGKIKSL